MQVMGRGRAGKAVRVSEEEKFGIRRAVVWW